MTLQVSEHHASVVTRRQQVVGAGREAYAADVARVRREALKRARAPDVVKRTGAVVVAADEQTPARIYR